MKHVVLAKLDIYGFITLNVLSQTFIKLIQTLPSLFKLYQVYNRPGSITCSVMCKYL
jgi:hypothetical protein